MTRQSSRRSLLCGLAGVPLVALSSSASTVGAVSPELARLIRKSGLLNARLKAETEADIFRDGLMQAAGVLRRRVVAHPSVTLADVLAKAQHTAEAWGAEALQYEHGEMVASETCYVDDMAVAVIFDLSRLAQA